MLTGKLNLLDTEYAKLKVELQRLRYCCPFIVCMAVVILFSRSLVVAFNTVSNFLYDSRVILFYCLAEIVLNQLPLYSHFGIT
jgi:hypothetical protein